MFLFVSAVIKEQLKLFQMDHMLKLAFKKNKQTPDALCPRKHCVTAITTNSIVFLVSIVLHIVRVWYRYNPSNKPFITWACLTYMILIVTTLKRALTS